MSSASEDFPIHSIPFHSITLIDELLCYGSREVE